MIKKLKKIKNFMEIEPLLKSKRIFNPPIGNENLQNQIAQKRKKFFQKKPKGNQRLFARGSLLIPSTILLFNLFHAYSISLFFNPRARISQAFLNEYCRKKLAISQNYLYQASQQLKQISSRSQNGSTSFSPLKKISSPSGLLLMENCREKNLHFRQKNFFFFSCYRTGNSTGKTCSGDYEEIFFNKNLPSIYFFNYQNYIENVISLFYKTRMDLNFIKIKGFYKSAQFIVDEIIYFLEKRVPYNKIKGRFKRELLKNGHGSFAGKGLRISYSGRLGGKTNKAERKKIDTWSFGQTSLHILSSNVDFAAGHAETKFGSAGVKVWLASDKIDCFEMNKVPPGLTK